MYIVGISLIKIVQVFKGQHTELDLIPSNHNTSILTFQKNLSLNYKGTFSINI